MPSLKTAKTKTPSLIAVYGPRRSNLTVSWWTARKNALHKFYYSYTAGKNKTTAPQKLRNALRAHEEASTKAQLQSQTKMIATLTAQNKDLKRKVGSVDIRLGHTEKAQRSSNNNNYKSVFVADDADEDEM